MSHSYRVLLSFAALVLYAFAVLAGQNAATIKGSIQSVNAATHRVQVTTDDGKPLTLHVGEQATLKRSGKTVSLDQFKPGMHVEATYVRRDGENRITSMTAQPVSAAQVRGEIRDALRAVKDYSFQQKDVYRQRLQRVMRQADDRIAVLQEEAAQGSAQAQREAARQVKQLRRLRDRAQVQLERVESATPAAWNELKTGISSALEDLGNAFENAGKQLRR
jgi:hypothetical protein